MRNYIILNNQRSDEISGLIIQELAPISKPLQRTQVETIDGRDGDIVTPLGYAAYDKKITIGLYGDFDINEIIAYFATQGTAIFSNEPDKYYNYQIVDQIDYERLVRYRVATVTMHVQPFKYSATEGTLTIDASDTVSGEGSDIALDGTAEAPFTTLRHKGNATQTTTTGINLLPPTADWTQTVSGVTVTCSNGQYTFSGTSTANGSTTARATVAQYTIQSGDYFHYDNTLVSDQINIQYLFTDNTYFATSMNAANRVASLSSYVGKTISACRVNFASGSTFNGAAAPMILHNVSTHTDYEPYTAGASPNPDYPQDIKVVTGAQEVTICGKNILGGYEYAYGASGATATYNKDGTLSMTGTCTSLSWSSGTAFVYQRGLMVKLKAGTYTFSVIGNNATQLVSTNLDGTGERAEATIDGGNGSRTFTITAERLAYARIRVPAGATNYTVKFMLEKSATLTDYEPHQSQSYEINFGKNLIDINSLATAAITVSDGVATGQGQHFYAAFGQNTNGVSFIKRGGQLSISLKAYTDGDQAIAANDGLVVRVIYTDGTSAIVIRFLNNQTTATTKTYTTAAGKDVASVQLTYANNGGNIWHISEFQIEVGQASSYAPYFTPIELAAIGNYADEPVKVDGTWYIRRAIGKIVLDGTEAGWSRSTYGGSYCAFWTTNSQVIPNWDTTKKTKMSDYFTYRNIAWNNGAVITPILCENSTDAGNMLIFSGYANTMTLADWQTWLSTHNTTVYYPLATPTDEAITNQDLIDALDALYDQAHSYKGHTHITATAADGNAPAILSVEVGEDNESTVTNAGNTTSRPILTIYGQGNIGVYINDVEVLDIALGNEQYITLDSTEMDAYKDSPANLKNRLVTGDYSKLALNAGANKIRFTGIVTKYEISKYSRWL